MYLTRKQQNRGKNEKAWRRKSLKGKGDEKDAEPQLTLDRMRELIDDGDQLGFQAPQIDALQEKLVAINEWRSKVKTIITQGLAVATAGELETLMEEGRSFIAAMPELTDLEKIHQRTKWQEDVNAAKENMQEKTLDECRELLARATELNVQPLHPDVMFLNDMCRQGDIWEQKANEVMSAEDVHYPQLESLHARVQEFKFPVNKETLAKMDVILAKNREAKMRIITLVSRSHDPDFRLRPMYIEARDIMKTVEDLNGKPHGTAELEKELKRHEDWMRKGKKLFGKANAPLHILEQHMRIVMEKNNACFDLKDTFRMPVEPSSRHASPVEGNDEFGGLGDDEKPIFCICRSPEAGLMIECEICHEWYVNPLHTLPVVPLTNPGTMPSVSNLLAAKSKRPKPSPALFVTGESRSHATLLDPNSTIYNSGKRSSQIYPFSLKRKKSSTPLSTRRKLSEISLRNTQMATSSAVHQRRCQKCCSTFERLKVQRYCCLTRPTSSDKSCTNGDR